MNKSVSYVSDPVGAATQTTNLSESEIQVLASLQHANLEGLPTDRASLENSGERYWIYLEDWSSAYQSLVAKGLVDGNDSDYRLTAMGLAMADAFYEERPDRMWYHYQKFWKAAYESDSHSRLCERAFGKDLCQDGMVDMGALEELLALLGLRAGDRLLDLGCGAGVIAEYISDQTGAHVTGLDNAAAAIDLASQRTKHKRERLEFLTADMNTLDLPPHAFDAVISLDTLYWAADLVSTLSHVVQSTKRGGQLGIFILQGPWDDNPPEMLESDKTELARALSQLNLRYDAYDHTARAAEFWRRNWQAAVDLRSGFEAEGNGFIADSLVKEAEEEFLPAIESGGMSRYLYHVRL